MKDYRLLAIRYIQQNKQRSVITMIGTAVTVMILYGLLNVGWGYLLQLRSELREVQDYELVLFTEDEEQIAAIIQDEQVKSAYVGPYYSYRFGIGEAYGNALYVNTSNSYRMDSVFEYLCSRYGVEGKIRNELAWTYLQGSDGSLLVVIIYFTVLAAFIFAIIGVGMIRNSIQLTMFENIRDYGNLRCIGSSKGELKMIIYLQGMVLELMGILIGAVAGTGATKGLELYFRSNQDSFRFEGGFHVLPLLLVMAVFLIDLYFAMGENVKLVTRMTPVEAIRGEYRIRKERIRLHEKNLFRLLSERLFGLDGDYAFKSLVRSPGRFLRTVEAMVFGIAAAFLIGTLVYSYQQYVEERLREEPYYQIAISHGWGIKESIGGVEASLPSSETLSYLASVPEFTEIKLEYEAVSYLTSFEEVLSHYTEEYQESEDGTRQIRELEQMEQCISAGDRYGEYIPSMFAYDGITVQCAGYDAEDLNRCSARLVDGTTELSEHGVLLVNDKVDVPDQGETDESGEAPGNESGKATGNEYGKATGNESGESAGSRNGKERLSTTYQVGDTIDIVDIELFHERTWERLEQMSYEYYELYQQDLKEDPMDEDHSTLLLRQDFNRESSWLLIDCWQELVREGHYTTYTVEGIVLEDVNARHSNGSLTVLMNKSAYYALTGTTENQPTGIHYHMDRIPTRDLSRLQDMIWEDVGMGLEHGMIITSTDVSYFSEEIGYYQRERQVLIGLALLLGFFVMVAVVNMINVTGSVLHLRRREFAQLRVIGVSKRHLMKMVMLEGVIAAGIATIIGIVAGSGFSCLLWWNAGYFIGIADEVSFRFPWSFVLMAVVLTAGLVCAAVYFPIRRLAEQDMAEDLKTSGD